MPSEPTYKYSDIRQGSSNSNFNTVEIFTTNDDDVVIKTVYIDPKYKSQATGANECVLRTLEKTFKVKVVFNDVNNKMILHGPHKQVKHCKADLEHKMSLIMFQKE